MPRVSQPTRQELDTAAPFVPWRTFWPSFTAQFKQGDHVTVIGPTESGKTHLAIRIGELRTYELVLACKPRDPLVSGLRERGYYITGKLEIPHTDRGDGRYLPHYQRVVFWPRPPALRDRGKGVRGRLEPAGDEMRRERRFQQGQMRAALNYAYKQGSWALLVDEGHYLCKDLNLQAEVDELMTKARTQKVSVIFLVQRPAWVGHYVLSQPQHLFIFRTAHGNDTKSLGNISGVDVRTVRAIVPTLDFYRHEFLYVNTRTNELIRSIADADS